MFTPLRCTQNPPDGEIVYAFWPRAKWIRWAVAYFDPKAGWMKLHPHTRHFQPAAAPQEWKRVSIRTEQL